MASGTSVMFFWSLLVAMGVGVAVHLDDSMQSLRLAQDALYKLFMNYEDDTNVDERFDTSPLVFKWQDCAIPNSIVHFKSLLVNPTCPKMPGKVMIGFNVTADADISPPISMKLAVRKRVDSSWVNICNVLPSRCKRLDFCGAYQESEETEYTDDTEMKSSQTIDFCKLRKGDTAFPPKSYDIPMIPSTGPGWYKVTANLVKGKQRIACLHAQFELCV